MTKTVDALRPLLNPKAPPVGESLSRRLAEMQRDVARLSQSGCVMSSEDVAELARRMKDAVHASRRLEAEKRAVPDVNTAVPQAFELLHLAEDALAGTRTVLRERLYEAEIDPSGAIRASLQVSVAFALQAEALIAGGRRMQS